MAVFENDSKPMWDPAGYREDKLTEQQKAYLKQLSKNERLIAKDLAQRIPQRKTAQKLGISQPAVCYKVKKIRNRMQYMKSLPKNKTRIEQELRKVLQEKTAETILKYLEYPNQRALSKTVGTTQGAVSQLIKRTIRTCTLSTKVSNETIYALCMAYACGCALRKS